MEETLQQSLLPTVRKALRIKSTTLYDEELLLYIDNVIHDFKTLDLDVEKSPALLQNACIFYAKSVFGIGSVDEKDGWKKMYEDIKRQVLIRGE